MAHPSITSPRTHLRELSVKHTGCPEFQNCTSEFPLPKPAERWPGKTLFAFLQRSSWRLGW